MNKKLAIIFSICCMLAIVMMLFFQNEKDQKGFGDILGTKEADITKILLRDGGYGTTVETTDKARIKEFVKLLNARYYKKLRNQDDKVGAPYSCEIFAGDEHRIRIIGDGDTVEFNNIYYDVSIPISLDSLTNWFDSRSVKDIYSLTFKGESKDWTAEYKVTAPVTSIDQYGLNRYTADKSLTVTYKNELADLSKVKQWEISCEYTGGGVTQSETNVDQNNPINNKSFVINCGGSPDSYQIDSKDSIIKVSVKMDDKIQNFELKCKQ